MTWIIRRTALVMLLLPGALELSAQTIQAPHGTCDGAAGVVADLGFSRLACEACLLDAATGDVLFGVEPVIEDVAREGPAGGRLRGGDVLVAVNDALITTPEGGRQLLSVKPGDPVRLLIRRESRLQGVHLEAGSRCRAAEDPTSPFRLDPAAGPLTGEPPTAPTPFFGATFWCTGTCSEPTRLGGRNWNFTSPPRIAWVQTGSRAAESGLVEGDEVLTVDGVRTDTPDGTQLFLSLAGGHSATLEVQRGEERILLRVP